MELWHVLTIGTFGPNLSRILLTKEAYEAWMKAPAVKVFRVDKFTVNPDGTYKQDILHPFNDHVST